MTGLVLRAVLVGLAAYRLARALTLDTITDPLRSWVFWHGHADPEVGGPAVVSRPWAWLYGLVSCPFCASWWIALALYLAWAGEWTVTCAVGTIAAAGIASLCCAYDRSALGA